MNPNQRRQRSYFEQQSTQANDPNFYRSMTDEDLRRQVRRIVKDIRNCTITQQDMIYFLNDRIRSACVTTSYNEWRKAQAIADGMKYYIDNELSKYKFSPENNNNIIERNNFCVNALTEHTTRSYIWYCCWIMFSNITRCTTTEEVQAELNKILGLNIDSFKYL